MRHGKKFNHLGRKTAHRGAMLSNMASSLIMHKRINTTVAKAKALRKYIEPILTRSKTDNTHSRRMVFSYLQNKESVTELFSNVADKITNRPGGYTRIIRIGVRLGDNAEMCMMELVDFNELLTKEETIGKTKTRRSRRSRKSKAEAETAIHEAEVVEEGAEETKITEAEVVEESTEEINLTEAEVVEGTEEVKITEEIKEETSEAEENELKADSEEVAEAATEMKEETTEEEKKEDDTAESEEKKD